MSILKIKKSIFVLAILFFVHCGAQTQVKQDPAFPNLISNSKRVLVQAASGSNLTAPETSTLNDLLQDQIAHHKEFIVYPAPPKWAGKCDPKFPKIEALFQWSATQSIQKDKLFLKLQLSLFHCKSGKSIWEGARSDSFSLKEKGNESLNNTFLQKYGPSISDKVNPYFWMVKEMVESVPSPKLTPEEEDEKIEVEAH